MLSPSFIEQVKCRWRELFRAICLLLVVFMPLLWMVILGFSFSNPQPEVYGIGWNKNSTKTELLNKIEIMID